MSIANIRLEPPGFYAHTPNNGHWHDLCDHLRRVSVEADAFARYFGGEAYAAWVGLLHDVGKFNLEFQEYLRACAEGRPARPVPHAQWGAAFIYSWFYLLNKDTESWKEIALPIAGHHAGLPDAGTIGQYLHKFLSTKPEALTIMENALRELNKPSPLSPRSYHSSEQREFFIRMIFSALVDADYLDTERHFDTGRAASRSGWPEIEELWNRFEKKQKAFLRAVASDAKQKEMSPSRSVVLQVRKAVYEACLQAADGPQGVYRLTVPTGGGKTRSGLAFALKHAVRNGLRRIVVAIPYTSIIDQTAKVFREILGDDVVLEHHSQVPELETEGQDSVALRLRLASENWEAPIIVTTTVQLFESLFANRPGRVRKLHNLAYSVILLDEVQTLPSEVLRSTLDVLRALVEEYSVTLVLSTATQPTFDASPYIKEFAGLHVREIVPDYPKHFEAMKRVCYKILEKPVTWAELADQIKVLPQVLVVFNTRKDALDVIAALGDVPNVYHLSTLLCGAHRRRVLNEITEKLSLNEPVRLISTQVVEAGVDLDFPVVYRAVGPLDRIVQVAGRCNREGRLLEGTVVVFKPAQGGAPRGPYMAGLQIAQTFLNKIEGQPEALHEPAIYRAYFGELFSVLPLDKHNIQDLRRYLNYPRVAELYRVIPEETLPVVVDYEEGLERLREWQQMPNRRAWRGLQPYIVSLFRRDAERFEREGWLEAVGTGLYRWLGRYDDRLGLVGTVYDPADLIISE